VRSSFSFTPAIAIAFLVALFLVERLMPLRVRQERLWLHVWVNLCVSTLAFLTSMIAVQPVARGLLHWTKEKPFGLLHLVQLPGWVEVLAGFLLLDLAFYYWHRLNHCFPFLWRFHNVHHIDPTLDVTTGFRFHFGEVLFSAGFRVVQISLLGVSVWTFAFYELCFQANTLFHHSNVRLPIRWERKLNKLLVTPRMHGIHHSQIRDETNSNYSVVLPWWDLLHRTLGLNIPQSSIVIGVPGYTAPEDNRLWRCLTLPFRPQHDYWQGSIARSTEELKGSSTQLAE